MLGRNKTSLAKSGKVVGFGVRQVQNVGVHLLEMKESGAQVTICLFLVLGKYKMCMYIYLI